jgi:predicted HTH domain antitoxin
MTIVQVRVDDDEAKELDDLAEKLGISKLELIRRMIKIGKKELLFDFYYDRLIKKEISLAQAAAATGMSIVEFIALAKERGFTYFCYDSDDLHRDLQTLKES